MPVQSVDAATLRTWIERGEVVLVDVREPAEHAARHIVGATLVPLGKVSPAALPPLDGKRLVLQCRSGMRSANACTVLQKTAQDMTVYNLTGGINAWIAAGLPVTGSGKAVLPLDRQVQLTIGLGLLLFSLLAWFVSPLFVLGTGFFGLGLSFAGLTGFCGLARLMALAPWNQRT